MADSPGTVILPSTKMASGSDTIHITLIYCKHCVIRCINYFLLAFPILLWYMLYVRAYYLYKDNLLASPILDGTDHHTDGGGAASNTCYVHQPMINWRDSHPASVGPREFYYWLRELTTIHVKVVLPNLWLARVIWLQQRPLLLDCRSLAQFVVE